MSKRPSIRALLIAMLAIGSLVTTSAQNPAPVPAGRATAPVQVPRVAVETFTLPNGLQVMVSRRPELPVVAVNTWYHVCLLYTSDAADERSSVDLGGRRIIK